jgi:hypothetical protein
VVSLWHLVLLQGQDVQKMVSFFLPGPISRTFPSSFLVWPHSLALSSSAIPFANIRSSIGLATLLCIECNFKDYLAIFKTRAAGKAGLHTVLRLFVYTHMYRDHTIMRIKIYAASSWMKLLYSYKNAQLLLDDMYPSSAVKSSVLSRFDYIQ